METITMEISPYVANIMQYELEKIKVADFVVKLLQEYGELSRIKIDNMVAEQFGVTAYSGNSALEWLYMSGFADTEVRAEEEITIPVHVNVYNDEIKANDGDNTVTIKKYGYRPYIVEDPVVLKHEWNHIVTIEGWRKIQVKRKYYKWRA